MTLSIVATAKVREGQKAEFEEAALRLVEAVNADEPGCLLYSLSKGEDPLIYVFMERYQDEDAIAAHQASDHYKEIGREMGAFMDGRPTVMVMTELD